ncbi:hypothetical protein [Sphaerisporangium fuscum]|uniref:hypothetical protein n=1 Tax=Sphaerisporangium fuscum TaxID=2835868 RepID=UPI0027E3ADD2|nr:hypothetical protein [Sphaerisporangium fuscum]
MSDTYEALAVIAAAARAAYADGAHLRVRSSGIVHQVAMTRWLGGHLMPGPACMVGVSGWDPGAAHPDHGEVTCRRCLKLQDRADVDPGQLDLFDAPTPGAGPQQLPAW